MVSLQLYPNRGKKTLLLGAFSNKSMMIFQMLSSKFSERIFKISKTFVHKVIDFDKHSKNAMHILTAKLGISV